MAKEELFRRDKDAEMLKKDKAANRPAAPSAQNADEENLFGMPMPDKPDADALYGAADATQEDTDEFASLDLGDMDFDDLSLDDIDWDEPDDEEEDEPKAPRKPPEWQMQPKWLTFEQLVQQPVQVLGYYDILENDDKDILLAMPVLEPENPQEPAFYYDGGTHALFFKVPGKVVVCDHVHPGVRQSFFECPEILVAEVNKGGAGTSIDTDGIQREYTAPMHLVRGVEELAQQLMDYVDAQKRGAQQ